MTETMGLIIGATIILLVASIALIEYLSLSPGKDSAIDTIVGLIKARWRDRSVKYQREQWEHSVAKRFLQSKEYDRDMWTRISALEAAARQSKRKKGKRR